MQKKGLPKLNNPQLQPPLLLPNQMHSISTSRAMCPHQEPKPAQEPARVSQAPRSGAGPRPIAVPDEPAVKAAAALLESNAGTSLEGNAGMKGKKLQVPPGTMLRRRQATSARHDPLGDELVRICLSVAQPARLVFVAESSAFFDTCAVWLVI